MKLRNLVQGLILTTSLILAIDANAASSVCSTQWVTTGPSNNNVQSQMGNGEFHIYASKIESDDTLTGVSAATFSQILKTPSNVKLLLPSPATLAEAPGEIEYLDNYNAIAGQTLYRSFVYNITQLEKLNPKDVTDWSTNGVAYFQVCQPSQAAELYRLYNSGLNRHFYTTSLIEANTAVKSGWIIEGNAGFLYPPNAKNSNVSSDPSVATQPLYRFVNPATNDHVFNTLKTYETGYVLEGIVGYVNSLGSSKNECGVNLFEVYSTSIGHFYTTNFFEALTSGAPITAQYCLLKTY